MTLFWTHEGPMIRYANGVLELDDLNPEAHMRWRMSRLEMAKLGWRCLLAVFKG